MSKSNIILIGFMGVGKGTVAREFIKQSGKYGIDTDDLIESMENEKIKKIFETKGEPYFRDLEQKTAKWLEKNVKNTIISTGGGFYKVNNLNKIGKIVYLKSSFEGILNRINSHPNAEQKLKKRPLLKNLETAKALFDERAPIYKEKADISIDVENKSLEKIVNELLKKI